MGCWEHSAPYTRVGLQPPAEPDPPVLRAGLLPFLLLALQPDSWAFSLPSGVMHPSPDLSTSSPRADYSSAEDTPPVPSDASLGSPPQHLAPCKHSTSLPSSDCGVTLWPSASTALTGPCSTAAGLSDKGPVRAGGDGAPGLTSLSCVICTCSPCGTWAMWRCPCGIRSKRRHQEASEEKRDQRTPATGSGRFLEDHQAPRGCKTRTQG